VVIVVPSPVAAIENVPFALVVYVYVADHAGVPPPGGEGSRARNGPAV
jgi:hypothetical protein